MNGGACSYILVTNFELRNANLAECEYGLGIMCEEHAQFALGTHLMGIHKALIGLLFQQFFYFGCGSIFSLHLVCTHLFLYKRAHPNSTLLIGIPRVHESIPDQMFTPNILHAKGIMKNILEHVQISKWAIIFIGSF